MKTEGRIRHQLKQLFYRYRKAYIQHGLAPSAGSCAHNTSLTLFGKNLGVCGLGAGSEKWNKVVCDDSVCPGVAKGCPYFQAKVSPEELKEKFRQHLQDLISKARLGDPGHLANLYPDVAALQWVLTTEGWEDIPNNEDDDDLSSVPGPSESHKGEGNIPHDPGSGHT